MPDKFPERAQPVDRTSANPMAIEATEIKSNKFLVQAAGSLVAVAAGLLLAIFGLELSVPTDAHPNVVANRAYAAGIEKGLKLHLPELFAF